MTCDGCVKDISNSLFKIDGTSRPSMRSRATHSSPKLTTTLVYTGIKKVDANLKDQLIFIEGTAPPSSIVAAIQDTGRDAILRGSGTTNSTSSTFRPIALFLFTSKLISSREHRLSGLHPRNTLQHRLEQDPRTGPHGPGLPNHDPRRPHHQWPHTG